MREHLVDDEISIGDYVLSGGEPAAMVVIDAVARQLPGVLGSEASLREESHAEGLLEYPQYTRPAEYRGMAVPEILLSGHHAEIAKWRRRQSILRTARRRPELLGRADLSPEERRRPRRRIPMPRRPTRRQRNDRKPKGDATVRFESRERATADQEHRQLASNGLARSPVGSDACPRSLLASPRLWTSWQSASRTA